MVRQASANRSHGDVSIILTHECIADSDFDKFILGSATLSCDADYGLPMFGYGGGRAPITNTE